MTRKLFYIVASEAGLYRNGLHGWIRDDYKASRFETRAQAQRCAEMHKTTSETFVLECYQDPKGFHSRIIASTYDEPCQ